jgi:signal transduction histidine kinase
LKLSLKNKIFIWLGITILISFILYGSLIYSVYQFNLRGENYLKSLRENPELDQTFIERINEWEKLRPHRFRPPPIVLLPGLFLRVIFIITGGVLLIIIIAASGGFLFLRRMLNQIDFITRNVMEIDEKRLHLRLNIKGEDPIANMARTFDGMLDKIESSFEKQIQFIQNASHEINTPLTVIKTKIDVLKQKNKVTAKEYRDTIELIENEVMRLSKITEELLVLSDLGDNDSRKEFKSVNTKAILKRMLDLFRNRIEAKKLKLVTSIQGKTAVPGNRDQMEQLFFNLMDNAVKYSNPESELILSLNNDKEGKSLIFNLTNTSKNLNKDDIPFIFDRFYKTKNGLGEKGFGLGLSISKQIVENHSGSIKVNYDEKKKTVTFRITLPLLEN